MPGPKSKMEGHSKLKIGTKKAHDMGDPWPQLEVKRSKVKVSRLFNAVNENHPYLRLSNFHNTSYLNIYIAYV